MMEHVKTAKQGLVPESDVQAPNRLWWEKNPMTYDWEKTMLVSPGTQSWFEEIDGRFLASAYYAQDAQGEPFGRFLRKSHLKGKAVLEIGCGMGTHSALIADAGGDLTAVDQTERAAAMTRRRLQLLGRNGKVLKADGEQLPFPANNFDMVWSWGVIHHSSSTERCLAEISRVLRPCGSLSFMVYYRPSVVYYLHCGLIRGILLGQLCRQSLAQIYVNFTDGFYARTFTKKELRTMLDADYADIRFHVVGLKAELFPIPRCGIKRTLERMTPDALASALLSRWGSMIVIEAVRK
jgi:ubiquinone/menaquinone biosynthesis C-methylase UbiE